MGDHSGRTPLFGNPATFERYRGSCARIFGILQSFNLGITEWQKTAFAPVDGRIYSSFGQPNFFGHYLIMVIPLTFYSIFFIFKKNISKILASALLLIQIFSLLLTSSRAAWLGFIFEIFLFLAIILLFYRKNIFKKHLIYKPRTFFSI